MNEESALLDKTNINENYINVRFVINGTYLASAEISKFPGENHIWYFNRLIVPKAFRNKKIATKLMNKLTTILDKNKIILYCDINPYGDLNFDQLKDFYKKFGFEDHDSCDLIRIGNYDKNIS